MTPAESISQAVRGHPWLYPAAEVVHLWGILLVAGPALLFDLRVLNANRTVPIAQLAKQLLPWTGLGLLIAVPAGLVLFAADALALLGNPAFRVKFLLLSLAAANAVAFHLGPARAALAPGITRAPGIARLQCGVSLLLWLAIVASGRMIAYV